MAFSLQILFAQNASGQLQVIGQPGVARFTSMRIVNVSGNGFGVDAQPPLNAVSGLEFQAWVANLQAAGHAVDVRCFTLTQIASPAHTI